MAGKEGAAEEKGEVLVGVEKEEVVVKGEVKEEKEEEEQEEEMEEEEARRRGRPASRCRLRGAMGRQAILLWKKFRF